MGIIMDLRRTTTMRFAALSALLVALPWATPAAADAAETTVLPVASHQAPQQPHVVRSMFWMNAMRSNLDRRARATASSRMRTDVAHMRASGTDLAVLAEVAADQRTAFRRLTGPRWAMVTGGNAIDNVVVYRRTAFTQVAHASMTTRYNRGQRIHVTIPVLRDNVTGTQVAVIPVHNPQWNVGPWRAMSIRLEIAKIKQLRRTHPQWRIVIAGDFNAAGPSACAFAHIGMASAFLSRAHCGRIKAIDQMYASPALKPHAYRSVHTGATDHGREYHAKLVL
ncbi:endonuclease/exonuclease/phosphatase family protein [Nocardioides nematodiphilus]|uniref:endonuclease/exonuclease/phosphatase family protein n=1 Tax=Nocardioides nematodiphilus TaxID=2849669 RepID=UPI001CD951A8|nr:endonuclease/exonuclease/phosphatase family protein [Nocardioides nematodiphilus]MCA1983876.1 endonuclease/exonuclease/phosphatase family protein [Nocardioides nematodiphilus]